MTLLFALGPGAVIDVLLKFLFIVFVLSAVLVMIVVLLQEGKGGGLGGAFGGAAAESFGVKAGTVNRFTAYLCAAFLGLALLHAGLSAWAARQARQVGTGETVEPSRSGGLEELGVDFPAPPFEPGSGEPAAPQPPPIEPPPSPPPGDEPAAPEPPPGGGGSDAPAPGEGGAPEPVPPDAPGEDEAPPGPGGAGGGDGGD